MEKAICLDKICKTYKKGKNALKNINLEVNESESFGFIGPNGAGKSTTIRIIMGLTKSTSGIATIWGKSVTSPESRRHVAFVPESPYLYDYLTPIEMLEMGCSLHKTEASDIKKHCMDWLDRFGIADVAKKPIRQFSKGMTQRTALAHALAVRPRLLILDEPLSGLDPIGRKDVVDVLLDFRKSGGAIFFSSHVLHDVERLADNFGLIHNGTLLTVKQPSDLLGKDALTIIRSHGEKTLEGMKNGIGNEHHTEVLQSEVWPTLNRLQAAGHTVIEVKQKLSLETAFFEYINKENEK